MATDYVDSAPNLKKNLIFPCLLVSLFLYGLEKTHKMKNPIPFRPFLSVTACYNLQLAKKFKSN